MCVYVCVCWVCVCECVCTLTSANWCEPHIHLTAMVTDNTLLIKHHFTLTCTFILAKYPTLFRRLVCNDKNTHTHTHTHAILCNTDSLYIHTHPKSPTISLSCSKPWVDYIITPNTTPFFLFFCTGYRMSVCLHWSREVGMGRRHHCVPVM